MCLFDEEEQKLSIKEAHMNECGDELVSIETSLEPSLSQALAGEIRREPVHAEGERELATVVQVMLQHMPDDPGARQVNVFAIPVIGEGLVHVSGTPTGQAIRHELPGAIEALG